MEPTIGRVVVFHVDEQAQKEKNNYQPTAPAIITAVWGPECVNLKVLYDGVETEWVTSAVLGTGDRQWSWGRN